MRIRVALILTIVAGLVVVGLNFVVAKKITGLQSTLTEQTVLRANAETSLAAANKNVERAYDALRQTTTALDAAEKTNHALAARMDEQKAQVNRLAAELASVQQAHGDTKANLAAYESVMTIEQAAAASRQIKSLRTELTALKKENQELTQVVAQQEAELNFKRGDIVFMPAGLTGTVLAPDPKWQFVVLNAGKEQGVLEHGELLVSRRGKLVGKLIVQRVDKDQSIANVMPGWALAEIFEGDLFIPAHPRS